MPVGRADEERLTDDIIELADRYGRYGYRMVTGLLNDAGWHVNHKRVERIWRREGLKVPTMSGLMTLFRIAPPMDVPIERSIISTKTQGRR